MRTNQPTTIQHRPTPGRYQVVGYVGARRDPLHRYSTRTAAQTVAPRILTEGFSVAYEASYTKVEVIDRVTGQVIWAETKAKKHYGR